LGSFLSYAEYIVRALIRFFRALSVRPWPTEKADVTGASCRTSGFGCALAELTYTYRVLGDLYTGTDAKPFIMTSTAEDYIAHYTDGNGLIVRINPSKPETSVILSSDQWSFPEKKL
jgi:hypothetical protein